MKLDKFWKLAAAITAGVGLAVYGIMWLIQLM